MFNADLLSIANMIPPDAFLEVMNRREIFAKTALKSGKSRETIILLILILGKIHKIPLKYHLRDLMKLIFGSSDELKNEILTYVNFIVDLEERKKVNTLPYSSRVWASLETFCNFGRKIDNKENCWADFTRSICGILKGRKEESLVMKFSAFSKLNNELQIACFYTGSIYASVEDLRKKPTLQVPASQNGNFPDAMEYLAYQMSHVRAYFLKTLYNGVTEFRKQEEKSQIVNICGTNIFPCVQIHRKFPYFLPPKDRCFLLDLAPRSRVNQRLPEEIRKDLTNPDFLLDSESILFLSTSPAFENMIVAKVTCTPFDAQAEGYLFVDILQVENIKENFLTKDLLLVTIPYRFSSKTYSLTTLKDISTVTLPMKEYLVDCKQSAMLPTYKNKEQSVGYPFPENVENDLTLEKINLHAEYGKEALRCIGMDERQFDAFKAALTKKLTLIEGPPGTGKTSIALGIVNRLLINTSCRILIISKKNDTLDRFLLQCCIFTAKIVRIGWQFEDPEIEKFIVREKFNDRRYRQIMNQAFCQHKDALKKFMQSESSQDLEGLREAQLRISELFTLQMYYNCREARIIGMTATGTAKYHQLLEFLRPSVVIVDRGTELSDWQIIPALTEQTQHLILFGDSYIKLEHECSQGLGKECSRASLLGRLIVNNRNTVHLNVQYRMHPEIADLLRSTLYPDLIDGGNVKHYKPVRGVSRNLFCVSQQSPEALSRETLDLLLEECTIEDTSAFKEKSHDELYCVFLVNYLRQQGYELHEIAILAANADQQKAIISILEHFPLLQEVAVYRVDGCGGIEYRIVIFSIQNGLDDKDKKFLINTKWTPNILSRGQEGLYILGQLDDLAEMSDTWQSIRTHLAKRNAIGPGLPVKCEKHGRQMIVNGVEDFLKFTSRGCPVGEGLPMTEKHPCIDFA